MKYLLNLSLLFFISISFFSCAGGGSEGTGGALRTISGSIETVDSVPVGDAKVILLETGDSTMTDSLGKFTLTTESEEETLTLEIEKGSLKIQAGVDEIEKDASSVDVSIRVNTITSIAEVSSIHIWGRIVGACDIYFENKTIIRQSNKVPARGVSCTAKVFASGDGKKLLNIPVGIQVRSCSSNTWRTIARGTIGVGVGQIPFTFIDSEKNCEYRIAAPYENQKEPLYIYISSFTLQNYEKDS